MRESEAAPHRARLRLILLGIALFLGSAYFYQDPGWNGNSRLDLTRAIAEQGTVAIDNYESAPGWDTGDKAFYNEHYYSDKAIGSSLLALPFYLGLYKMGTMLGIQLTGAVTKHVLTTTVMGTAFTATGLFMFGIAERLTREAWKAATATLALAFGTMLWPYSAVYYGHVPAAAFLIACFAILFHANESQTMPNAVRLLAAGLMAGLAFITDYTSGLIIAGLIMFGAFALRRAGTSGLLRAGALSLAGAALPLCIALAYNAHVYGSAVATGYAYEVENRFAQGMSQGVLGIGRPDLTVLYRITLDPQIGVLWQSPVLILVPVGYILAFARHRSPGAALLSLYAAVAMLAMNAGYYLWWGGSAFGPRLLIPALPFLIIPLALVADGAAALVAGLGIVSALQMLIPLMGQIQPSLLVWRPHRGMFYVDNQPFQGFSLLYNYGLPQIRRQLEAGEPAWTLGSAVGLPYLLSVPALLVSELGLALGWRGIRSGRADASEEARAVEVHQPSSQ